MSHYSKRALIYIPSSEKEKASEGDVQYIKDNTTAEVLEKADDSPSGSLANWQMTQEEFDRLQTECAKIPGAVFIELDSWDPEQMGDIDAKLAAEGVDVKPAEADSIGEITVP